MSQIITVDELKVYLGISSSDTSQDEFLTSIVKDIPEIVFLKTGRWYGCEKTITETYDFAPVIFLNEIDVQSVVYVKRGYSQTGDYDTDPALTTVDPINYRVNDVGRVLLSRNYFRDQTRYDYDDVVVKYVYGNKEVPGYIRTAALQMAGDSFRAKDGEVTSESIDKYRVSYKPSTSAASIFDDSATGNV